MSTKLILIIIFGYVFAKHEQDRYIRQIKTADDEKSQLNSDYSPNRKESLKKMLAYISDRLDCTDNVNWADLATKADLADLKKDLIDEISALIAGTWKFKPIDCGDIYDNGYNETGIYRIFPSGYENGIQVRCDMDTSGGGWTVIQRRVSNSDFYKTWNEYENGFGNLTDNFYLGNRLIHQLTNQGRYLLRVDLICCEGEQAYAEYSDFSVGDAESYYKLNRGKYSGTAGDALKHHTGMKFSTYDKDNDSYGGNCAQMYHGAWWYKECHNSNLNGEYDSNEFGKGTNWKQWKGHHVSMKTIEMKVRRK